MKVFLPLFAFAALVLCGCPNSNPTTCNFDSDCGSDSKRCCNGECKDISADKLNCGTCGAVCPASHGTASCEARICKVACDPGRGNCDNDIANGCETDLNTDKKNCGSCTLACAAINATAICSGGTCNQGACDPGFADCNKADAKGCETHTEDDLANCGTCGNTCTTANGTPKCFGGACAIASCNAHFGNCDNDPLNGCESNLQVDAMHCGTCEVACMTGEQCLGGTCRKGGLIIYGGVDDPNSSTPSDALTRFDPETKAFEAISAAIGTDGAPEGRSDHMAVWDSAGTRMIVFGGFTGVSTDPAVWSLDFTQDPPAWSKLPMSAESPGARRAMCYGFDRATRTVYGFGGNDEMGIDRTDFWKLNVATGEWTQIHPDLTGADDPPALSLSSCAFIPDSGVFVMFGGFDAANQAVSNVLWTWNTKDAAPAWAIAKVGNPPAPRFAANFFEGEAPLPMFGGATTDAMSMSITQFNDVQRLDLVADPQTWSEESATGAAGVPFERFYAAGAAANGKRYVYGGVVAVNPFTLAPVDDVWEYDTTAKTWTELSTSGAMGAPTGKFAASLVVQQ